MRLLVCFITVLLLWQSANCANTEVSIATLSKQKSLVGFKAKKHDLSFRKPLTTSFFFSDSVTVTDMYNRGKQDAKIFYKNRSAFWIPFGVTVGSLVAAPVLLLPGMGTGLYLLPGVGTSLYKGLIKPNAMNLKHHDVRYRNIKMIEPTNQLFQDSLYVEGYRKGAQQHKLEKAAGGFGAGLGVTFLLVITLAFVAMTGG